MTCSLMEAVAAVGLASNVVSFLDFACKLVAGSRAIYKSVDGLSPNNTTLTIVVKDLKEFSSEIVASLPTSANKAEPASISLPLRALAGECQTVAKELSDTLEKL